MKDSQDGYSFVYPFGWQEVAVKGQDVVYKDVIEPLESVSVSITQTDKANVSEFGSPAEACPYIDASLLPFCSAGRRLWHICCSAADASGCICL